MTDLQTEWESIEYLRHSAMSSASAVGATAVGVGTSWPVLPLSATHRDKNFNGKKVIFSSAILDPAKDTVLLLN